MSRGGDAAGAAAALRVRPGYCGRMRVYLREMYPASTYVPLATLLYLDVSWLAWRAESVRAPLRGWSSIAGIGTIYAVGLLTRLMDELKDEAIDRRLFPQRPLPSGRILAADIRRSIVGLIAAYICINVAGGAGGAAGWLAGAVLGCALLAYQYFFMRQRLESSLPLTLLTHSPLVALVLSYATAYALQEPQPGAAEIDNGALLLSVTMFWTMIESVEVARKIRAPEEETDYNTYSKAWGPANAVFVALALQTWTLVAGLWLWWRLSLPPLVPIVLLIGYGIVCGGHGRFLSAPAARTSNLQMFARTYGFLILLAFAAVQWGRP